MVQCQSALPPVSGQSYVLVGEPESPMGQDLRAQLADTLAGFGFEEVEDPARE